MCNFVEGAVKENRNIALFDIVFSVPVDEWFDSSYVSCQLGNLGIEESPYGVERSLRDWASAGLLTRDSGFYQVSA